MKRFFEFLIISILFVSSSFSQNGEHINGGQFSKLIEYNLLILDSVYNHNSKEDIEKRFWGKFNAPVEFYYSRSTEAYPVLFYVAGFRILMDSINKTYTLEVKHVTNYIEASAAASAKFPLSYEVSPEQLVEDIKKHQKLTEEEQKAKDKQREEQQAKNREERNRLSNIETISIPITPLFAELVYKKTVSLIDNFSSQGLPRPIYGGFRVIFRTVVGNEVWSLNIHVPKGNALKMTNMFEDILNSAIEKKFNESIYIQSLESFDL